MIWTACGIGLGDVWASLSYIFPSGIISKYARQMKDGQYLPEYIDISDKICECLSIIDQHSIVLSDNYPDSILPQIPCFRSSYPNTIRRWQPTNSKTICYQFDAVSAAGLKQPTEREKREFFTACVELGISTIDIGHHRPLRDSLDDICDSKAFVGIDSGLTHVCLSTGIPVYMCLNNFYCSIEKGRYVGKNINIIRFLNDINFNTI